MKERIKQIPLLGPVLRNIYRTFKPLKEFDNSASYWDDRYKSGGTSGAGSFGKLAKYKASFINDFVARHTIQTIIEHGCGDGNQLLLAEYVSYTGYDVSPSAITLCKELFRDDNSKIFRTNDEYNNEKAELALSLDVIYHLVEDETFHSYMKRLFNSAEKFVIIYSSNKDEQRGPHERHRAFTPYIDSHFTSWKLIQHEQNRFPYDGNERNGSLSDFFIYQNNCD